MNKIKDEIISMLIEHSRIIYSIISDMGVYYSTWATDYESKKDSLENKKGKMQLREEDADDIKIQLIKNYSDAGAQGLENYVALILKMDNTINPFLEFIEKISNIENPKDLNIKIKRKYEKLIEKLIEMGVALKAAIKNLRDNPEKVFKNTTTLHEIENEIDTIYRQFVEYLYTEENLEIRTMLRIKDSIILLEKGADLIHDIADSLRVIVYQ